MQLDAIDHLVFNVRDVDISAEWYARALGMSRRESPSPDGTIRTAMTFGRNKINLRPRKASADDWFTALSPTPGSDDVCFLTAAGAVAVADHFRRSGIAIVTGPVVRDGAQGRICSIYVRDPDGNLIEVASPLE